MPYLRHCFMTPVCPTFPSHELRETYKKLGEICFLEPLIFLSLGSPAGILSVPVLVEPDKASRAILMVASMEEAMPSCSGSHWQTDSKLPFHDTATAVQISSRRKLIHENCYCSTCTHNSLAQSNTIRVHHGVESNSSRASG